MCSGLRAGSMAASARRAGAVTPRTGALETRGRKGQATPRTASWRPSSVQHQLRPEGPVYKVPSEVLA